MYLGKNLACELLHEGASKVNAKFKPLYKILQLDRSLGRFCQGSFCHLDCQT